MGKQYCCVKGCSSSTTHLKKLRRSSCDIHADQFRWQCVCVDPYKFYGFPKQEDMRTIWLQRVLRQHETFIQKWRVCSKHFVGGAPNPGNPYPMVNLGHDPVGLMDMATAGYNEEHQKKLQFVCRLCGDNEGVVKRDGSSCSKFNVRKEILLCLSIDVCRDSHFVHPQCICYICRAKLSAWKSTRASIQITPPTFVPHTPDNCAVCSGHCLKVNRLAQKSPLVVETNSCLVGGSDPIEEHFRRSLGTHYPVCKDDSPPTGDSTVATAMASSKEDTSAVSTTDPCEVAMEDVKPGDAEEDDRLFVFDFKLDMDDIISSTLKELCEPEHEDTLAFQSDMSKFSQQLRSLDRKTKEVRKIYTECSEKLRIYREELLEADREEELKEAAAEIDAKEAAEANAKIDLDSDDDDVQFVATTYEPSVAEKRQALVTQNKNIVSVLQSPMSVVGAPVLQNEKMTLPPGAMLVKLPPNSQSTGTPTLQSLRDALAASINKQIPSQLQQIHPQLQQVPGTMPSALRPGLTLSQQNQQRMEALYKDDVQVLDVGSKILGKKFNDIWYKGTIGEIQFKNKSVDERKFCIKFDGKGKKLLSPKHVAFRDAIVRQIYVGTRVIALYRDEDSSSSYYAGIVAETPNGRNQQRYLIFFDDGYAQYSSAADINKVLWQSQNVWEDIHPDSQEFIKEYLKQYPERPMVRLQKGQGVKTEWNGNWWTAKVMEVDASLVKMYFLADKRVEWIYRGSTRLEPLYAALANAEYNKTAGKVKRHTLEVKGKTPVVEYTRGVNDTANNTAQYQIKVPAIQVPGAQVPGTQVPAPQVAAPSVPLGDKKRPVARKSTTGRLSTESVAWEAPWSKQVKGPENMDKSKEFVASSISNQKVAKDMASVLQDRLSKTSTDNTDLDDDSLGHRMESKLPFKDRVRKKFRTHKCGKDCLKECDDDPIKYKGGNPLLIPLLCGWERHVCKMKPSHKRVVMYRTPCARRLRNMDDVDAYLLLCNSSLTIDMFCFDPILHVHTEFVPVKTFCDIKDLSYGKENVPISCVNAHDRQYPDYVEYSNVRIPAKGVKLNLDPDFLVCCSCTDGCNDRSKCECQQLTVEATGIVEGGKKNPDAGYEHRRLKEPLSTGVYECNSRCKCDHRCFNRVAQNGLYVRLQVFKTEKKGWGLRCLDDLPSGGFICIYAGQLLTEQGANEDGQQYGDEYLAELDYMEVVERQKEGYESDADVDEGVGQDSDEDDEESDHHFSDTDSDFSAAGQRGGNEAPTNITDTANPHRTRTSLRLEKNHKGNKDDKKPVGKILLRRDSSRSGSKEEEWYANGDIKKQNQTKSVRFQDNPEKTAATAAWINKVDSSEPITIDDDDEDMDTTESSIKKSASVDSFGMDSDSLPDLDTEATTKNENKKTDVAVEEKKVVFPDPSRTCVTARRSTSKMSRFKNLPDPKKKLPVEDSKMEVVVEAEKSTDATPGTRSYFKDNQECYIMDAKSMGNIGRYLNHSCTPNVFVQNVFVDTHDLRFPWVTFFAGQYIRAGTELTWDYNYEVGSVPDKILYCYCGSAECRGRLL